MNKVDRAKAEQLIDSGWPVKTIVLHRNPHCEEILAKLLAQTYQECEDRFPGIHSADIKFWDANISSDGSNWAEAAERGEIRIGRGGGPFDEHAVDGEPRKEGKSAALLFAEYVGIAENPELARILELVTKEDLQAGMGYFDLPHLIKTWYKVRPEQEAIEWAENALQVILDQQRNFFGQAQVEFEKNAQALNIVPPTGKHKGKALQVVVIESDDSDVSAFARSGFGCGAVAVVQRRSTGHTLVLPNKLYYLVPWRVAAFLRIAEQLTRGKLFISDWDILVQRDTVTELPWWHFHKNASMIMNGSSTASQVEVTALSLKEVAVVMKVAVESGTTKVPLKRCAYGECSSRAGAKCPFYDFEFDYCANIRNT